MYKLAKLPPPVPYAHSGRVWKKPETKQFYELVKGKIKTPPDWLAEWQPGMWVRLNVQFVFATTQHGDPENYNKALVNGITQAIQVWQEKFDDKWILIHHNTPIFGKKEAVIFELELVVDDAAI
jgi:hypothetical protein